MSHSCTYTHVYPTYQPTRPTHTTSPVSQPASQPVKVSYLGGLQHGQQGGELGVQQAELGHQQLLLPDGRGLLNLLLDVGTDPLHVHVQSLQFHPSSHLHGLVLGEAELAFLRLGHLQALLPQCLVQFQDPVVALWW